MCGWTDASLQEARHSLRSLGKAPGFTATAVAILALAIGANSALFSVVYGVLLRPLPYREADRLVLIECERHYADAPRPVAALFRPDDLADWRGRLGSFEAVSLVATQPYALSSAPGSQVQTAALVSSEFFSTVDGRLAAGRPLGPVDDKAPSVAISDRLARQLFDVPERAVGTRLVLNSRSYDVVGVLDRSFAFPSATVDLWLSAAYERTLNPGVGGFRPLGRLKPGITIERARAEVNAAVEVLRVSSPASFGGPLRASVRALRDHVVGDVRPALLILWAAAGLILFVSCANVAQLLLARNVSLARERMVRVALGASGGRLLLRGLIDGGLLAAGGAVVGVAMAALAVPAIVQLEPTGVALLAGVHINLPVLLFAVDLTALTAMAIGALPAIHWARHPPTWSANVRAEPGGRRVASGLCIAELAVATVLLVGASLLSRSLIQLLHTDIGVNTDHVTAVSFNLAFRQPREDSEVVGLADRIVARIRELPGVSAAGVGTGLPPNASGLTLTLKRKGDTIDYAATGVTVTPGYFDSLGVRLLRGRLFTEADDQGHAPVVVVSEATARRLFGAEDAIGRTMTLPTLRDGVKGSEEMTLVGVISAVKYSGLASAPDEQVYRPFAQQPWRSVFLVVRTERELAGFASSLRRQIAAVDPALAVASIKTLDSIVGEETASPRFRTALLGAIALLGLTVAGVGLYAVVAYSVSRRTAEIGVRLALGARPRDVTGMVVREAAALGLAGTAVGLAAAYAGAHSVSALLFGVTVTDLASYLLASGLLLLITLAASYLPARRASRVDPLVALRTE